ncbi:MAG: exodeoxyribonuclease VII large subunit [Phycisphaerae bacterium]
MASRKPFDPSRIKVPDEDRALFAKAESAQRWSVKEFNERVRAALGDSLPATVHVVGEIGDLSRPASGHLYFTLKDADSELRCVMWRSAAEKLKFKPEIGLSVVASGPVDVYVPRGTYQLNPRKLEPVGVGALELAFRQLREKLAAEGLFDARHKIALPAYPNRVAVITSPSGAALHDIIDTMRRRNACIEILLFPVRVQGTGAAEEIAHAIQNADRLRHDLQIDAIIVGRGGGSLEDLWAFNEEVVARAVYACETPIVSAIGHEVDVSIADLVADVRAATPTAAAELIAPDCGALVDFLTHVQTRLRSVQMQRLEACQTRLTRVLSRESVAHPMWRVREAMQRTDECGRSANEALVQTWRDARDELNAKCEAIRQFGTGEAFLRARAMIAGITLRGERALQDRMRIAMRRVVRQRLRMSEVVSPERTRRTCDQIAAMRARAHQAMRHALLAGKKAIASKDETLTALDPRGVLRRGYALVRDSKSKRVIRSRDEIRDKQRLIIEVGDGSFRATADDPNQLHLFE